MLSARSTRRPRALIATGFTLVQACWLAREPEKRADTAAPVAPSLALPNHPGCAPGDSVPSRAGFFHEALFPEGTTRTPRFDDYTAGSYHVNKLDLVEGLPAQATLCGVRLKALLVVGPVGLLWQYNVATVIEEGAQLRVNALAMPHARITGKATGTLAREDAAALLESVQRAALMRPGAPIAARDDVAADFAYSVLLAIYDRGTPEYFHAAFNEFADDPDVQQIKDRITALLRTAKAETYGR